MAARHFGAIFAGFDLRNIGGDRRKCAPPRAVRPTVWARPWHATRVSLEQLAPIRSRTKRLAFFFVAAGAVGIAVPDAQLSALVINSANAALSALAAWAVLRRARAEPSARRGWLLFSGSLWVYTAGQLATGVSIIQHGNPFFPTVGDLVAFCFLPLAGISFLLLGDPQPRPVRLRSGLDGLIFALATFFLVWSVALSARDMSAISGLLLPVGLAFAIASSVDLGILVHLLGRSPGRWRGPLGYAAVAFLVAGVTGVFMVILGIERRYYSGHAVDFAAILGMAIGAVGAVSSRPVLPARDDEPRGPLSLADVVPYAPVLLVALTSMIRAIASGHHPDAVEGTVGIAILVAVSMRQLLTQQDLRRLSQTLELKVRERTRQLEISQAALLRSQRLEVLGQMAGGVVHDLNNLLTVLSMSAVHLRRANIAGEEVDAIEAAVTRASVLTRNLLAFSRKQPIEPCVLDLDRLVDDLMPILERLAGRAFPLSRKRGPSTHRTIADRGQIEQVIVNLVANARDAMPTGGEIELGAATEGDHVVLWVRDQGVGMPPEVAAHACEPFFTTKDPGHGTGLGLATSWGIVQHLGGTLQIDSEPGQGTTVRIRLPGTGAAVVALPVERSLVGSAQI
jgi:signal transduction histidine kinase